MTCFSRDNPSVMQKTARLLTEADHKSQKEQCILQRRFKESSRGGEGEDLSERLATREREKEEAGTKINPLHYYPDQQQYEQKIDQEGWSLNCTSAFWLDLWFWKLLFTSLYLQEKRQLWSTLRSGRGQGEIFRRKLTGRRIILRNRTIYRKGLWQKVKEWSLQMLLDKTWGLPSVPRFGE